MNSEQRVGTVLRRIFRGNIVKGLKRALKTLTLNDTFTNGLSEIQG
jgi:hypothetical protein